MLNDWSFDAFFKSIPKEEHGGGGNKRGQAKRQHCRREGLVVRQIKDTKHDYRNGENAHKGEHTNESKNELSEDTSIHANKTDDESNQPKIDSKHFYNFWHISSEIR
ncbi:hypothetical protein [Chryseolinea soli]|uniref:hypothetical protein n=1 Tax=Chryseolinea soli TaxID=2321403 RepID=UPI001359D17E|nr:hypothetical protein [Chryseolinea soli]